VIAAVDDVRAGATPASSVFDSIRPSLISRCSGSAGRARPVTGCVACPVGVPERADARRCLRRAAAERFHVSATPSVATERRRPGTLSTEEARQQDIAVSPRWRAEFHEKMAGQCRRSQPTSKMKIDATRVQHGMRA
jgi:hypothetical protein